MATRLFVQKHLFTHLQSRCSEDFWQISENCSRMYCAITFRAVVVSWACASKSSIFIAVTSWGVHSLPCFLVGQRGVNIVLSGTVNQSRTAELNPPPLGVMCLQSSHKHSLVLVCLDVQLPWVGRVFVLVAAAVHWFCTMKPERAVTAVQGTTCSDRLPAAMLPWETSHRLPPPNNQINNLMEEAWRCL